MLEWPRAVEPVNLGSALMNQSIPLTAAVQHLLLSAEGRGAAPDHQLVKPAPKTAQECHEDQIGLSAGKTNDRIMTELKTGRYRHFKGNEYTVLGIVRHSESLEELVLYRQEYGDRGLWVRPAAMFLETVEFQGQIVPRFQYLRPEHDSN